MRDRRGTLGEHHSPEPPSGSGAGITPRGVAGALSGHLRQLSLLRRRRTHPSVAADTRAAS